MPKIDTTKEFKDALRAGPYAWPGGYPIYFIADDGEAISYDAAKSEAKLIISAIRNRLNDGWRVVGVDINYEDDELTCAHTGKKIECAYPKD